MSPHGSSILPSADDKVNWAGYPQTAVYMNLQLPDGTASRSPDCWWSLTPPSHPYPHKPYNKLRAVVFFCPNLLSPIACIFTSGTPFAARTFLSHTYKNDASGRPRQCFQNAKIIQKVKTTKHFPIFFFFSMFVLKIQTVVNDKR